MCNQSLFKLWRHLYYWRNNSQDILNIENLMQTFENLILQNYSTKFLDITIFTRVQVDLVYKSTPDFGHSKQGTNFYLMFGNHDIQLIPVDRFPDVSSQ